MEYGKWNEYVEENGKTDYGLWENRGIYGINGMEFAKNYGTF
jgi:hypothetical protein